MATTPVLPPNKHIPYKKGGWGAAILTTAAAAGAFLTAWYIHNQTYRHPRDIMMRETFELTAGPTASGRYVKAPDGPAAAGGHAAPAGAPAGEHGAPAEKGAAPAATKH